MGCGSSKLKGDEMTDLSSSPPPPAAKPSISNKSPTSTSISVPPPTSTSTMVPTQPPLSPPEQQPPLQPKKQTFSQRYKERKRGVSEPKDENGRGLYTGKTTDELVKIGASQVIDGRILAGDPVVV